MLDLDSILQVHSTSCDPTKPSYKKKEVYNRTLVQGRSNKNIRVAVLACDR
jgi:hypothetical protein